MINGRLRAMIVVESIWDKPCASESTSDERLDLAYPHNLSSPWVMFFFPGRNLH